MLSLQDTTRYILKTKPPAKNKLAVELLCIFLLFYFTAMVSISTITPSGSSAT